MRAGTSHHAARRIATDWGLYYISMQRLRSALVTVPFLSDQGLVLVLPAASRDFLESAKFILAPFTGGLWLWTAGSLIFVSWVMCRMRV